MKPTRYNDAQLDVHYCVGVSEICRKGAGSIQKQIKKSRRIKRNTSIRDEIEAYELKRMTSVLFPVIEADRTISFNLITFRKFVLFATFDMRKI